jgi:hypothetical protein
MALKLIRLELARTKEFPAGSARHGYEFVAPLDAGGHLDAKGWKDFESACTVRRFWGDAPDEQGTLVRRKDGKWAFSYEPGDADDEPIFRFDRHAFVKGEYVSVTEHDGTTRTFRVAAVETPLALRKAPAPQ